ncbi:L-asparaginase 1 [bioreactor metagenome]|uniref:asparaginase n=1 Tax=bioreactor metagenome TaxID=1076179 RepID=A0A644V9K8_9ZZZZ|nr:asparaginase [Acidaminococcaceae bacterium]
MKNILFLTTGGTIVCEATEDGLIPSLSGQDIIERMPELKTLGKITVQDICKLDSSNIQPENWSQWVKIIGDNYDKYDGFVITHGTDTMAYTSSALSYMLINLGKPVVLTGSQVPLNLANSDARSNLDLAFTIATSNLTGVFIAFGNKVIKGDCAKKIFAKNFNAFESVNETPVLFFDKNGVKKNLPQKEIFGDFFVVEKLEPRVMAISITPGLKPDIIDFAIAQGYKGIVLECFGAGGVATDKNDFLPAIKRAIKAGVRVVCVSQCLFDGVDLTLYPMGILAAQAGVESGGVMTLEAALTKLMVVLANE